MIAAMNKGRDQEKDRMAVEGNKNSTSVVTSNGGSTGGGGQRSNKSAMLVKQLRERFLESYEMNKYEGRCVGSLFPCRHITVIPYKEKMLMIPFIAIYN